MKFEFVSYLPGGFYQKDPSKPEGVYTRLVETEHYALIAQPQETGCLLALWAATAVRFDAVYSAERMIGLYEFPDILDIGEAKYPINYGSPLSYLKWWKDRESLFLDWELYLVDLPVSVYMNVPHAHQLIGSLNWLVASANCQPAGLSYELADLDKSHKEDEEIKGDVKRASESDVRAIKAANALSSGKLKLKGLLTAFNLQGGPTLVKEKAVVGSDGFLDAHRKLLADFRQMLLPYVGRVPKLGKRFIDVSDLQLGIELADLYNGTMRQSFPDIFAAQRAQEEIRAAEARRERESKKKG